MLDSIALYYPDPAVGTKIEVTFVYARDMAGSGRCAGIDTLDM